MRGLALAVAFAAVACVSQGRHRDALEAERVERERVEKEKATALGDRDAARQRASALEKELAQARYELEATARRVDAGEATIEQLRSELARVAEHIRHFANRNKELEGVDTRLERVEADVAYRIATLSLLNDELGSLAKKGGVELVAFDGYPAVRFAAGSAVSHRGLNDEAKRAVAALAKALGDTGEMIVLFAAGNQPSHSVAITIADAVREKAATAPIEALEGEGVKRGVAIALLRRRGATDP